MREEESFKLILKYNENISTISSTLNKVKE